MNPFSRFKNWIIGDALAETDDVFEKARITLTYNFTVFFIVLGLVFYGNIFANRLWWQFYITTFGVITLPLVLVALKKTKSVQVAGYIYIVNQVLMSIANQWLYKFELNIIGGFWSVVSLVFAFFVLGKKWGIFFTVFVSASILLGSIDAAMDHKLLDYHIPPEQLPEQLPVFVFVPFLLVVYALYQIVDTRSAAERKLREQKLMLVANNKELETKNKDITDSINYAQRIQYAVLPGEDTIYRSIPLSFILYKPKNIVSGDFFWFHEIDANKYILVNADCTGHGVPGALMTVIGSNLLNQVIIENHITKPSEILSELDRRITITLKQEKERLQTVHDGMDLALIYVDKAKKEFIVTSAKRPSVFIRNREMQELKGSKFTLGGMRAGEKKFEEIRMNYQEDDIIYFFTDGYADQFGGEKGKKFSNKRLRETLLSIHRLPMNEQKQQLDNTIETWKGNLEQVDDICVIGIRF